MSILLLLSQVFSVDLFENLRCKPFGVIFCFIDVFEEVGEKRGRAKDWLLVATVALVRDDGLTTGVDLKLFHQV